MDGWMDGKTRKQEGEERHQQMQSIHYIIICRSVFTIRSLVASLVRLVCYLLLRLVQIHSRQSEAGPRRALVDRFDASESRAANWGRHA